MGEGTRKQLLLAKLNIARGGVECKAFCVSGGVFCVKHRKLPEISSFRDTTHKKHRAGCSLGKGSGAAENGPEQNSSNREA